jgi:hypothetical protein
MATRKTDPETGAVDGAPNTASDAPEADDAVAEVAALQVTGTAVVLRTAAGGERYLYTGAPVDPDVYTTESLEHAKAVGLIG